MMHIMSFVILQAFSHEGGGKPKQGLEDIADLDECF